MNTAIAFIRITAVASAVTLGMALTGCQGTRSEETSGAATTSVSSTVHDDLSPNAANSSIAPSTWSVADGAGVGVVDDDLSPLAGR